MTAHATAQGPDQRHQHTHATQAADAVRRRDREAAAQHFSQAAAAPPPDPHNSVTAAELILRRQGPMRADIERAESSIAIRLAQLKRFNRFFSAVRGESGL